MKYCVIKDTTIVIDGSENIQEIMYQNAVNAGFTESEVEILTEEEYKIRKSLEPVEPLQATDSERIKAIEEAINMLITISMM